MMMSFTEAIRFRVNAKPEPQGSMRAFLVKGKPVITSANKNVKTFRNEVQSAAIQKLHEMNLWQPGETGKPIFEQGVPVALTLTYTFIRPKSKSKKTIYMTVRPDLSKLLRATEDALTGIIYHDDCQIIHEEHNKTYGDMECVEITVYAVKEL